MLRYQINHIKSVIYVFRYSQGGVFFSVQAYINNVLILDTRITRYKVLVS